ncbi:MAG: HepT-like ribonuclease domain-containing protein [Candidatus Hodarchaeales archaeon]|jgi:uncharacterized protein with HEPN domain
MSSRALKLFLDDILKAISKINLYMNDLTYEQFQKDLKTVDAVIRNLEIIGEAVKNLPSDIITKNPEVNWRGATAMRDRLIHGYFGVDVSILWETVTTDLPELNRQIEKIWDELEE